jgi:hypothetical protein
MRIILYDISQTATTYSPKEIGNNLSANQIASITGRNMFLDSFQKPWNRKSETDKMKTLSNQSIQRYTSTKFKLPTDQNGEGESD